LAEIEQGKGNISSSGVLAKQFLTRFDRANPSHPAVMLASEILSEAGFTITNAPIPPLMSRPLRQ
jgi:hypothetical protein